MRQGTWQGIDHGRSDPVPQGRAHRGVGRLRPERAGDARARRRRAAARDRARPVRRVADGARCPSDRRPTLADLDYHLTTLFPPVRPRGYIEIRCIDALPDRWWPALVATLAATLLDDPVAARGRLASSARRWPTRGRRAARDGIVDHADPPGRDRMSGARRRAVPARRCGRSSRPSPSWSRPAAHPAASCAGASRRPARSPCSRRKPVPEQVPDRRTRTRGRTCPHASPDRPRRGRAHRTAQSADEPARLGPRAHRPAGGPLAAAWRQRRRAGPAVVQDRESVRRVRAPACHPGQPAAAHARRGDVATSRTCAVASSTAWRSVDDDRRRTAVPLRDGRAARAAARRDHAGHPPAPRGAPLLGAGRRCRRAGAWLPAGSVLVPAGPFTLGVDLVDEPVVARQRAPGTHRRPPGLPDRPHAGQQRGVAGLHRCRWLRRSRGGGPSAAGATASTRASSGRCSGRPTVRAGGSVIVEEIPADEPVQHICFFEAEAYAAWAGAPSAHRAGVGEGVRLGPGRGSDGDGGRGATRSGPPAWPTSVARPCGPHRWAPTRRAPPPTASSS